MEVFVKPDETTHIHGAGISHINQIMEPLKLNPAPGEVIDSVFFSGQNDQINSVPTILLLLKVFLWNKNSEWKLWSVDAV